MKINKKENNGIGITCNLDKKSYDLFRKELINLSKKYEDNSKVNNLKYSVFVNGIRTPYISVRGWASRNYNRETGEIKELLFIDADGDILYWIIKEELRYLMKKYNLPPCYVFTSKPEKTNTDGNIYGNYLIINLNKNSFQEVIEMHKECHCCDSAFKFVGSQNQYRTWVTRLGIKGSKPAPKFKEIIGDINKVYDQDISNGHLQALYQLYPEIPKINYPNADKSTVEDIYVNTYLTASK